ncbi:hypothetical protein EVAR_49973_1 [Eumeta japonica]|uniref:Uncharacterized protein n=1 Tax=Eumeta variegata TaxID=151549 RepID=A0A4C1YJ15_EUMVA|nr:hypothetical protein EVAR_49973_1 [Eumeta japonica]
MIIEVQWAPLHARGDSHNGIGRTVDLERRNTDRSLLPRARPAPGNGYRLISSSVLYRNSDVEERCGLKEDVVTRAKRGMLRWFCHLEKGNESRKTKPIYTANVYGKVGKGHPIRSYANHMVAY